MADTMELPEVVRQINLLEKVTGLTFESDGQGDFIARTGNGLNDSYKADMALVEEVLRKGSMQQAFILEKNAKGVTGVKLVGGKVEDAGGLLEAFTRRQEVLGSLTHGNPKAAAEKFKPIREEQERRQAEAAEQSVSASPPIASAYNDLLTLVAKGLSTEVMAQAGNFAQDANRLIGITQEAYNQLRSGSGRVTLNMDQIIDPAGVMAKHVVKPLDIALARADQLGVGVLRQLIEVQECQPTANGFAFLEEAKQYMRGTELKQFEQLVEQPLKQKFPDQYKAYQDNKAGPGAQPPEQPNHGLKQVAGVNLPGQYHGRG